jgi:chromosome segregation ATPase
MERKSGGEAKQFGVKSDSSSQDWALVSKADHRNSTECQQLPRDELNKPRVQVEKEKDALWMELNKAKQQLKETDEAISAQKAEIDKLNHIINEADDERLRQKKEYDIVINERDILGVCSLNIPACNLQSVSWSMSK